MDPLTILHEAGHAIVARILGWLFEVYTRFWHVARIQMSGIRVEVRAWPSWGWCIRPSNKNARIKMR